MTELSLQNCRLDGRFDTQSLLGRGSYAEIYVARDILAPPGAPHSQVVIKALNVFMQDDLDADLERTLVENFQNEAIALDRVRHPNVISRLGHGTAKDLRGLVFHYLVLEYLPGGDLAKACPKQGFPLEQALDYLEQVCAGLAHAHKEGVIHRDIKPQNLLLTRDRRTVKIADFGVARITQSDSPITRVGTNMYAPPEHSPVYFDAAAGAAASAENVATAVRLTPAADVYSLAKAAYVLITGESPRRFAGAPISDLPESAIEKPWANELLRILRKATQSSPAERHQSVNEFWRELGQIKLLNEQQVSVAAAEDFEAPVSGRGEQPHVVPQPSVSKDFSPVAPARPKFDTSRELKYRNGTLEDNKPRLVVELNSAAAANGDGARLDAARARGDQPPAPQPRLPLENPVTENSGVAPGRSANNSLKRVAVYGLLLLTFAAALVATQSYFSSRPILPGINNPFRKSEGVALVDVNLRETPGVEKPPIGVVPKGSRVRITDTRVIESKDTWFKIKITEFSRPKENAADQEEGWVNGRYIKEQEQ